MKTTTATANPATDLYAEVILAAYREVAEETRQLFVPIAKVRERAGLDRETFDVAARSLRIGDRADFAPVESPIMRFALGLLESDGFELGGDRCVLMVARR